MDGCTTHTNNPPSEGWFSEIDDLWPGQAFSLKIKKVLHEEKSKFQDIKIIETETYGTCLILDGRIQCTTRDEFSYQEMISYLPLCCHPNPERVLIVGGGDGGVAREVAKHPLVKEIHQVEIDSKVVELSKIYLPGMACGFNNEKLHLTIGDGLEFMKNHINTFDVIITDSSDPVGPAVTLFQESYYELMKIALRSGGVICSQAGSYWLDMDKIENFLNNCKKHFPNAAYTTISVPTYPCGQIGFIVACLDEKRILKNPIKTFSSKEIDAFGFKYYNSEVHSAAFVLPNSIKNKFV